MPKETESIKKKRNTSKQGKTPNLGLAAGLEGHMETLLAPYDSETPSPRVPVPLIAVQIPVPLLLKLHLS